MRRSKLSVRTGRALRQSSDSLDTIEEADQVFPGEVVDEERDRRGDGEEVRDEGGDGKVQKASDNHAKRREQDWQERAVEANGELQARAQRHEENIPKAPGVGHHSHREDDHPLHGNGKIVNVAGNGKDSGDDQEKNRGHNDARHVRPKTNVLSHKASSFTGDTTAPEWNRG